jgi:hypothetical protein
MLNCRVGRLTYKMKSEEEFPEEFNAYLSFLEEQLRNSI